MMFIDSTGKRIGREEFVDYYSEKYFTDYQSNNREDEDYIKEKCETGIIDFRCIAWKMGRNYRVYEKAFEEGHSIPNGYGLAVDGLKDYLKSIDEKRIVISNLLCQALLPKENIENVFAMLADQSPKNFGTVYIITVMFFLSQGRIPIYDQFAHKAVKAIFFEKTPSEIYVGSPPSKRANKDAVNILDEYMWFLDQVFGKHNITRKEDQALWTYGHLPLKE